MDKTATRLVQRLRDEGYLAYLAGGCVRDMLRGVEPKDFDIATDARPDDVLKMFPRSNAVGAHFGVILVKEGGFEFEIATFRTDGSYSDGRRPDSVAFSTPEEDAKRRDFTVNGLFYDPMEDKVIDYVGGRKDLENHVLRAIGDPAARFAEDYLRMLRAIRLAVHLDYEIEPATWAAIGWYAEKVTTISPERNRAELDRIWLSPRRLKGFDLLDQSGLMKALVPEFEALKGCEQPPKYHPEGDVFTHTRLMLELLQPDASVSLVWAVLLHDIAKPVTSTYDASADRIRFNGHDKIGAEMAETILRRLRYPNEIIDAVVAAVDRHMVFKDVQKMRTSTLKRLMARPTFEEELELHRVDCLSSHRLLGNYEYLLTKEREFVGAEQRPLIPERLLNGEDLIQRGWQPGPAVGRILTEAQDLQLDGTLTTRDEALAWLDQHYPAPGRE